MICCVVGATAPSARVPTKNLINFNFVFILPELRLENLKFQFGVYLFQFGSY